MIKKIPQLSAAANQALVAAYVEQNRVAFYQDVAILKSKVRIDNPLMCDGDGPVNLLRQWYGQFYKDVAEVGNKWQQRREVVPDFLYAD
jgi:3-ketosteroid 9alpha-monooxygenase subunit A